MKQFRISAHVYCNLKLKHMYHLEFDRKAPRLIQVQRLLTEIIPPPGK